MGDLCGQLRRQAAPDGAVSRLVTTTASDRDRIIHSKAFRRRSNKTQVFISPEGDHYRARLTHTLEVAQIARTIARALGLNEDLTEAIADTISVTRRSATPERRHSMRFVRSGFGTTSRVCAWWMCSRI